MTDEAHRRTDRRLAKLEKTLTEYYSKAYKGLEEKTNEYFAKFAVRDAEQRRLLAEGSITKDFYSMWRLNQIGRGERYEAMRDEMAERMTRINELAAAYINDATPGIYSLNRNYAAYTIEQVAGDVGFTLFDEQTVRKLAVEAPDLMPYYPPERAVKRGIDIAWGKRQITAQITQSILMGDSIKQIADRLQTSLRDMNRTSAIRSARTASTAAQNAGRMDSYAAAAKMGIMLQKQWLATLDGRTRHSHTVLDYVSVANDKKFPNGCMFPGDPSGPPAEIYNCRCTIIAVVDGVDTSDAQRSAIDPVTGESVLIADMNYQQWEAWKKSESPEAWGTYMKKSKNYSADQKQYQEYKSVLGEKVPNTFAGFQNMKYNNPEKWESVKTLKKQTVFVKNAPCQTTPKKYSGYFLKEGTKHADEFFSVGYTRDNPMQLRYDMARQFDMGKAVDNEFNEMGEEKFSVFMELGISERKSFRTVWQKDTPDGMPRIITAHREAKP